MRDEATIAGRWIGYCLGWARARERLGHAPGVDWEQVAIDAVFAACRTHDGSGPERHWVDWHLRGAASNARASARRARRKGSGAPLPDDGRHVADPGSGDEVAAVDAADLLARVPEPERSWLARVAAGESGAEIAAGLGVSREAINKRLRKAVRRLAGVLGEG